MPRINRGNHRTPRQRQAASDKNAFSIKKRKRDSVQEVEHAKDPNNTRDQHKFSEERFAEAQLYTTKNEEAKNNNTIDDGVKDAERHVAKKQKTTENLQPAIGQNTSSDYSTLDDIEDNPADNNFLQTDTPIKDKPQKKENNPQDSILNDIATYSANNIESIFSSPSQPSTEQKIENKPTDQVENTTEKPQKHTTQTDKADNQQSTQLTKEERNKIIENAFKTAATAMVAIGNDLMRHGDFSQLIRTTGQHVPDNCKAAKTVVECLQPGISVR